MEYIDLLQGFTDDGLTASPVAENATSLHVNTIIQVGLNPLKQRKLHTCQTDTACPALFEGQYALHRTAIHSFGGSQVSGVLYPGENPLPVQLSGTTRWQGQPGREWGTPHPHGSARTRRRGPR
eukprot:1985119-Pyramimonas_sp.AAC.1